MVDPELQVHVGLASIALPGALTSPRATNSKSFKRRLNSHMSCAVLEATTD